MVFYRLYAGSLLFKDGKSLSENEDIEIKIEFGKQAYKLANKFKSKGLEVILLSSKLADVLMTETVYKDMSLTFACVGFIWVYMTFHLKSFFLSSMSMLNISMSIPVSLVIYKMIVGIEYFSVLNILIFLVVIGIGADNTFIFNDTWIHTG